MNGPVFCALIATLAVCLVTDPHLDDEDGSRLANSNDHPVARKRGKDGFFGRSYFHNAVETTSRSAPLSNFSFG